MRLNFLRIVGLDVEVTATTHPEPAAAPAANADPPAAPPRNGWEDYIASDSAPSKYPSGPELARVLSPTVVAGHDYLYAWEGRTGHSHGVSIRLARGLYYSPRTFRGKPVKYQETALVDSGIMTFTAKRLYFAAARRASAFPTIRLSASPATTTASTSSGTGSTPSPGISLKEPAKSGSP